MVELLRRVHDHLLQRPDAVFLVGSGIRDLVQYALGDFVADTVLGVTLVFQELVCKEAGAASEVQDRS